MAGRLALSPVDRGIPPLTARLAPRLVNVYQLAGTATTIAIPAAGTAWGDRRAGDTFLAWRTKEGSAEPTLNVGARVNGFSVATNLGAALWVFDGSVSAAEWSGAGNGVSALWHLRDVGDIRSATSVNGGTADTAMAWPAVAGIASPAIVGGGLITTVPQTDVITAVGLGASYQTRYNATSASRTRLFFDSGPATLPSTEASPAEVLFSAFAGGADAFDTATRYGNLVWSAEGRMAA